MCLLVSQAGRCLSLLGFCEMRAILHYISMHQCSTTAFPRTRWSQSSSLQGLLQRQTSSPHSQVWPMQRSQLASCYDTCLGGVGRRLEVCREKLRSRSAGRIKRKTPERKSSCRGNRTSEPSGYEALNTARLLPPLQDAETHRCLCEGENTHSEQTQPCLFSLHICQPASANRTLGTLYAAASPLICPFRAPVVTAEHPLL